MTSSRLRHIITHLLAPTLAAVALLAACSSASIEGETEFDIGPVEKDLTKQLDSAGVYDTPVLSIACPNKSSEKGATYSCDGETEGGQPIQVEVTNTDNKGNFDWTLASQTPTQ